ncbi:hypothetical protein [Portibacter lacus]|uniref:Uncharacterized protein n=1 Tax=Portibacter lacus TaxID=1099794 RepID=A0AA37SS03_9BACT|nr:hypothetical protein [Portibacter lacus]GLR17058.1 hypothetical protein GCM10007940_16730 [Portibacter lacus]
MENTILEEVDVKRKKTITIIANKLNDLDIDMIVEQMELLMERFDQAFLTGNCRKIKKTSRS